jgi:hypothetical protein
MKKNSSFALPVKAILLGTVAWASDTHYPVSATALEPVDVCFIDLDFFLTSLKVNHDFTFQLMMFFAEELQESERKMRNMAHMPVKGRVVQALLKLKQKYGETTDGFVDITITKQDIASYAGTTYETVFRIMNELEADKIIGTKGKNFRVINQYALEKLLLHWKNYYNNIHIHPYFPVNDSSPLRSGGSIPNNAFTKKSLFFKRP